MPVDVEDLKILGIDEISLVKGQGKFIVVLVDLETHKLVGLVSSRTLNNFDNFKIRALLLWHFPQNLAQ